MVLRSFLGEAVMVLRSFLGEAVMLFPLTEIARLFPLTDRLEDVVGRRVEVRSRRGYSQTIRVTVKRSAQDIEA